MKVNKMIKVDPVKYKALKIDCMKKDITITERIDRWLSKIVKGEE